MSTAETTLTNKLTTKLIDHKSDLNMTTTTTTNTATSSSTMNSRNRSSSSNSSSSRQQVHPPFVSPISHHHHHHYQQQQQQQQQELHYLSTGQHHTQPLLTSNLLYTRKSLGGHTSTISLPNSEDTYNNNAPSFLSHRRSFGGITSTSLLSMEGDSNNSTMCASVSNTSSSNSNSGNENNSTHMPRRSSTPHNTPLTTLKILSPRKSMGGAIESLNISTSSSLRINTNINQPRITQESQRDMDESPSNDSPLSANSLRTGGSSVGSTRSINPKKPKRNAKLVHGLPKLEVPVKREGAMITDSGTWVYDDLHIAPNGVKPNTQTPASSASATQSPFSPPLTRALPSSTQLVTNIQQLQTQFRRMSTSSSESESTPSSFSSGSTPTFSLPASSTASTHRSIPYDELEIGKKSKLGTGASATVLLATSKVDKKAYALKVIPLHQGDNPPKQIISEVKSLYESVECPYIVRFYEAYHREGSIRILLEYMNCGTLKDVYETMGKIPEDVLSNITYQILCALDYLARKKIVHRDIKPSNILLNREGMAKIADFGMSNQLNGKILNFQTFVGTFVYMSPERLKGKEHSFESDVWSLGVSIAECIVGRYPFNVSAMDVWSIWGYVTNHGLDITTEDASPELVDFLKQTTVPDPQQRPAAAQLLNHPWIVKYQDEKHSTKVVSRWLTKEYEPKRKEMQALKHKQNSKRKNSLDDRSSEHNNQFPR